MAVFLILAQGMGRAVEQRVEILERGNASILVRPRVEDEVQRLLIVLAPAGREQQRVIAAVRNPASSRFWGFVDVVGVPLHVAAMLEAQTYLTEEGAHYLPAAHLVAEGTYTLTATHFECENFGDFLVMAANPDPAAWGLDETPRLQEELFTEYEVHVEVPARLLAERFNGRRSMPLEPDLLDIPGLELIFDGVRSKVET